MMVRRVGRMYDPAQPFRLAFGGSGFGGIDHVDTPERAILEPCVFSQMEPFAAWAGALPAEVHPPHPSMETS